VHGVCDTRVCGSGRGHVRSARRRVCAPAPLGRCNRGPSGRASSVATTLPATRGMWLWRCVCLSRHAARAQVPPLVITDAEIDTAAQVLARALNKVAPA
jgi:hypothetical protein